MKTIKVRFVRDYDIIVDDDTPIEIIEEKVEEVKKTFDSDWLSLSPTDSDCFYMEVKILNKD